MNDKIKNKTEAQIIADPKYTANDQINKCLELDLCKQMESDNRNKSIIHTSTENVFTSCQPGVYFCFP